MGNAYSTATVFRDSVRDETRLDDASGQAIGFVCPAAYIPVMVFGVSEMKLIYALIRTWTCDDVQQSVGMRVEEEGTNSFVEERGGQLREAGPPFPARNGRTVCGQKRFSQRFRILV